MKTAAFNRVISHVVSALPDSLAKRKELLSDVLAILPTPHPFRIRVSEMLNLLDAHERHQLNLSLEFSKTKIAAGNGKPEHDGR